MWLVNAMHTSAGTLTDTLRARWTKRRVVYIVTHNKVHTALCSPSSTKQCPESNTSKQRVGSHIGGATHLYRGIFIVQPAMDMRERWHKCGGCGREESV